MQDVPPGILLSTIPKGHEKREKYNVQTKPNRDAPKRSWQETLVCPWHSGNNITRQKGRWCFLQGALARKVDNQNLHGPQTSLGLSSGGLKLQTKVTVWASKGIDGIPHATQFRSIINMSTICHLLRSTSRNFHAAMANDQPVSSVSQKGCHRCQRK